ncbi:MAG: DUF4339 domain-containing protein [Chitinophagaceae bacterium]
MKKYFLNDGTSQQGPFDLEELKTKNLTASTPVWYEGLPEWTTAGKVEELKVLFTAAPVTDPVPAPTAEEIKPVTPVTPAPVVTTSAAAATTTTTAPKPVKTVAGSKKSTAWLSYVLGLLVLGGVGYLVYQDMEKNKTASSGTTQSAVMTDSATSTTPVNTPVDATATTPADTATMPADTTTMTVTTDPVTTTVTPTTPTTTTTATTSTTNTAKLDAAKKAAAKKAEEEKKKQAALAAQKKAADEKKKLEAAKIATAARELNMRNNWSKYITFGKLNYETKGDGINAFDVPVYNGTDAILDKVTVRIDYMKKEKKLFKSETIVLYRIPPRSGLVGKAPESKKGELVNVYITAISSRQLHLCYPQNNGNSADPYFCN